MEVTILDYPSLKNTFTMKVYQTNEIKNISILGSSG